MNQRRHWSTGGVKKVVKKGCFELLVDWLVSKGGLW